MRFDQLSCFFILSAESEPGITDNNSCWGVWFSRMHASACLSLGDLLKYSQRCLCRPDCKWAGLIFGGLNMSLKVCKSKGLSFPAPCFFLCLECTLWTQANTTERKQKAAWQVDSMGSTGPGKTQTPSPPLPSDGNSEKRDRVTEREKERRAGLYKVLKQWENRNDYLHVIRHFLSHQYT